MVPFGQVELVELDGAPQRILRVLVLLVALALVSPGI